MAIRGFTDRHPGVTLLVAVPLLLAGVAVSVVVHEPKPVHAEDLVSALRESVDPADPVIDPGLVEDWDPTSIHFVGDLDDHHRVWIGVRMDGSLCMLNELTSDGSAGGGCAPLDIARTYGLSGTFTSPGEVTWSVHLVPDIADTSNLPVPWTRLSDNVFAARTSDLDSPGSFDLPMEGGTTLSVTW